MRFLLLDINSSYSHSSLAIPALTSQLRADQLEEHEWRVVRGTTNNNPESIISEILSHNPDFILSTLWLFNHLYSLNILKKTKTLLPETLIYLGGPEFLGDNANFLAINPEIEAVFKGEGEEIFSLFIDALIEKKDCKEIPGFCHRESESEVVRVKNFNSLTPPEKSPFFEWEKPFVQIETSRGCFNRCKFCISGRENKIEDIPVKTIHERLDHMHSRGVKEVRILDRTFNANPSRAIELLELFRRYEGKMRFHIELHPAYLNQKLMEVISSSPEGLLHIEAGIQSLNDDVIKQSGRKGSPLESLEGVRALILGSMQQFHLDLIAGMPGYTYSNMLQDIDTLIKLRPGEIQLELLKLLPGTDFREQSEQFGIKYSPIPPYEVLSTEEISYDELREVTIVMKALDYWYNSSIWREPFSAIYQDFCSKKSPISFWREMIEYLGGHSFIEQAYSKESKGIILFGFAKKITPAQKYKVTIAWVLSGLSLKKEPAKDVIVWKREEGGQNPILIENETYVTYAYLTLKNEKHWFAYDKREHRNKPVRHFIENI